MSATYRNRVIQFRHPHLTDEVAVKYVEGEEVPEWVESHLQSNCEECHDLIYAEFDRILERVEDGQDSRDLLAWLLGLGDRLAARHLCQFDLTDRLIEHDERAIRHARFCPLCRREVEEFNKNLPPEEALPLAPHLTGQRKTGSSKAPHRGPAALEPV